MQKFIISSFSFIGGVITGVVLLFILSIAPLRPDNILHKLFGIHKQLSIGFLPYGLLSKADKNYSPAINTVTYFGLTIDTDGTLLKLANKQEEEPGWHALRIGAAEKQFGSPLSTKRSLLVFLADEERINKLLAQPNKHASNLVKDVAPLMKKYKFDDLNIDIESFENKSTKERQQFIEFLTEVKKGMTENKLGTITVEISPSVLVKPFLIEAKKLKDIVDYVVLMAYDYHYAGSYISGPVAPIDGVGTIREFDVRSGIKEAIKVIPPQKIILGIPLYGYEWETLSDYPGSPVIPGGSATASNRRVSKLIVECTDCKTGREDAAQQPYLIFPEKNKNYFHQIFYEDTNSLTKKINLVKEYRLAGTALWALGYEGGEILQPLEEYQRQVEWIH